MEADKSPATMAHQTADEQVDVVNRAVAFPDDNIREEKIRPKGIELKRTLTQEEKDLSAAGYEHLDANAKQRKLEEPNLDIQDHKLPLDALSETFTTSFNSKDPGQSIGLTAAGAKSRLEQDGPNILTPPKKKSALRKVKFQIISQAFTHSL
jgi:sodium/potassium-transporting ATPase subunit alpha